MQVEHFVGQIKGMGIDTLVGVPDSTLKPFCDYIHSDGKGEMRHYVAANEGTAVGIAIGTYLATGKPACVYMQNSGLGNTINPFTSLAHEEVYGIPMLFLVGWRGEPGTRDEPQHRFMGEVTESLLEVLGISHRIVDGRTTPEELAAILKMAQEEMEQNRCFAIVIKKDTFGKRDFFWYANHYTMVREEAIAAIVKSLQREDVVVSTTGKISRELYEQADRIHGQHQQEFLTVGGMGHASMIAFGIAMEKRDRTVFCLDGDGAVLMHMGALAFLGKQKPENLIHICLNNEAHESVGGMSTGAAGCCFADVAGSCGYENTVTVDGVDALEQELLKARVSRKLCFLEVMVSLSSREDLGRPRESAAENKEHFMNYHDSQ